MDEMKREKGRREACLSRAMHGRVEKRMKRYNESGGNESAVKLKEEEKIFMDVCVRNVCMKKVKRG